MADAVVEATVRFLEAHAPFSGLARDELLHAAARTELAYFAAGTLVLAAGDATAPLHVIQGGHIHALPGAGAALGDHEGQVLGPGECFPVTALAPGAGPGGEFRATEDAFCLRFDHDTVAWLQQRSPAFRAYCGQAAAALLRAAMSALQREYGSRVVEQQLLLQPLAGLARREPVACTPVTRLRAALAQMQAADVGTIVIVNQAGHPVGIFTLTDLLARVVLPGRSLDLPIAEVMTPGPAELDAAATAQEALALMATRGLHQVLVTREGRLAGVVSERDLFSLQRASLRNVLQSLRGVTALDGLRPVVRQIEALAESLIAQGTAPEPLTQVLTALNDAVTQRLLGLLASEWDLDGLRWCWLALGSEGRREQTVVTDQDNAIIFACAPGDEEGVRARLLPFARAANAALARLGFPLCSGNIMAGNPACCLAVSEWRGRFAAWLREPTPEALLNANIYFDLRPLQGEAALATELQAWMLGLTQGNRLFLGLLAQNALEATPPLGVIRSFRTAPAAVAGVGADTLDLKAEGTRLFVDAARALALSQAVAETGTAQRLRIACQRLACPERDIAAWVDAFQTLQLLRLRAPPGCQNHIDPYALNALDQRLLKESLLQARSLQALLRQSLGP
jgi:CBS domain-containing protein